MDLKEFEKEFATLGNDYKTKDVDRFNKGLIKRGIDVSFLRELVLEKQQYHRTYFQVSLGQMKTIEEKDMLEKHFLYLLINFLKMGLKMFI